MAETFGKYNLLQKIAQGGMAEIFLATREGDLGGFEKQVAIKRIFRHLTGREETVKMFFDEARIAATLNHPNIVQIFDLGEVKGYFYIAMEFVHGTDLRRICKRGLDEDNYLPIDLAARIVADTAGGLHYAHTRTDDEGNPRNIVHRDISPQNILLSMEGHVKICDFGIAKAENRLARTRTGQFKGKLSYMSPEQFNGEFVDARSDVFNLGIVLYEVTLARRLFDAKTDFERMRQIANAQVTPPSEIQPDFPGGLERIIMKALHHDPAERYQTAEQMQVELENWLHQRERKVGTVQISEYMEQVFPELVGGIPEDMSQVEFPSEGREGPPSGEGAPGVEEHPGGLGAEPSASEESTEEFDPSAPADDATMQVPRDQIPTGDDSGESSASSSSNAVGGVTIDPSQQPDQRGGSSSEPSADQDDERTRPVQVGGEAGEATGPEDAADSTRPTPIREQGADASASQEGENFGVRPRHDSTTIDTGTGDGSGPQPGEGTTRDETPSSPASGSGAHRQQGGRGQRGNPQQQRAQQQQTGQQQRGEQQAGANRQPSGQRRGSGQSSKAPQRSGAQQSAARQGPGAQNRGSQPADGRSDQRRSPDGGGDREATADATPNPHANRGDHRSGPSPSPGGRSTEPQGPAGGETPSGGGGGPTASSPAGQGEPGSGPQPHRSQAPAGETGEHESPVEPRSSLRDSMRHSVDSLTSAVSSLDNRRQKLLAAVGFAAAVIGLGVFGYLITRHSPDLSSPETSEGAVPPDAGDLPDEPQVDTVEIDVTSKPEGARVVANGLDTGATTPTSVRLVEGAPNEMFLYKKGHRPVRKVLDGTGGESQTVELETLPDDAPRQTVEITSSPEGATAYLDGREVGETPVTAEDVAAGHLHHVRLERTGYHPTYVLLQVRLDESTPVSVNLAESKGRDDAYCEVVYDSVPQGSTVTVNGEVQGSTNVAVRHGCEDYLKVEVASSNYEPRKHYLHLQQRGKYLVRSHLEAIERESGKVRLEVPDSLRVYIGSNAYGKGSVDEIELQEGDYTAIFETEDRERFQKDLTVHPDKTTTYRVRRTDDGVVLERVAN